jgi:parvulin-like peptidyl-prolyl isomerase
LKGRNTQVTIDLVTSPRRLVCASIALVATCACNRFAADPGLRVVAEVGSKRITAAQLQAYLDANQFHDPDAEPPSPGDLARVKSRLFDDFLDSEVLLQEAQRRGVTVTDAELADYLGKDGPKDQALREVARRDLSIQKLRESVVLADVHVDDKEIDAWLAARTPPGDPALQGTLRTLRFASYPEAMRVRNEILSKRLSFDEAELAYGADSLPDAPRDADLEALPPQIAAAAKALKPGTVSQPLPFESSVLLFLLEAADDPSEAQARRRDAARRAIALDKAQAVADKLLDELRAKTTVTRHVKELPFAYVAEDVAPRAQ